MVKHKLFASETWLLHTMFDEELAKLGSNKNSMSKGRRNEIPILCCECQFMWCSYGSTHRTSQLTGSRVRLRHGPCGTALIEAAGQRAWTLGKIDK
jgi:hypothetical protein